MIVGIAIGIGIMILLILSFMTGYGMADQKYKNSIEEEE